MIERVDAEVRRELERFGPVEGDLTAIVRAWPSAVGATVARSAWPARLARDGTLHVATVSATWAFELGRLAETIHAQLAAELGEGAPPTLAFAPGPVPESVADGPTSRSRASVEASADERAEAAALVAGVADEDLRRLLARAAAASLARRRRDRSDGRCF